MNEVPGPKIATAIVQLFDSSHKAAFGILSYEKVVFCN